MQHSRHRESCYSKQVGHYDSIIRINILGSDSLDACTCGGLYCSAEPLPMGFTLPHTRLAFKHLRQLSCQRLRPPATLTTWVSLLYLRLTDPLEFQDAVLTWILTLIYIHYTSVWKLPTRLMELRLSHTKFMFHALYTTFISNIQFSCKVSTIQPKIHVVLMPTYQFQFIWIKKPYPYTYFMV